MIGRVKRLATAAASVFAGVNRITAGSLEVRLAQSDDEIDAAQALRYRVFYEEMSARPGPDTLASRRDRDHFDRWCDHLLVIDHARGHGAAGVVGTYRLLQRE